MKPTPRMDIITCKHCGEPVALIPRAAIVGRFALTCQECRVIFVVYPLDRRDDGDATMPRMGPARV